MKKGFAYLLVAALSVSMLVGCGSKSDKKDSKSGKETIKKGTKVEASLTDVLEGVAEAATTIESISISINGEGDLTASAQGQEIKASGKIEGTANAVKDDAAMDLQGKASYNVDMAGQKMSGDYKMEAYGETEGDKVVVYSKLNDEDWEKNSSDKEDFEDAFAQIENGLEQVKEALSGLKEEDLEAVAKYMKLEDTTKVVGGKECYVLAVKVDAEGLQELAELGGDVLEDSDFGDYLEVLEGIDEFEYNFKLYFDKTTYLPVKVSLDATMDGEVQGTQVKLNKLTLDVTLSVNDDVKIADVPKDAKESAKEASDDDFDFDLEEDEEE